MPLEKYNAKRHFDDTPEPKGKLVKDGKQLTFVVQRHEASHLHYDFRLELNGVMLSWAVPKGPSLNPADKRLAVQVEDHPVSYSSFQGDIPEGNYGAGHVDVWDAGTYEPVNELGRKVSPEDFAKQLEHGALRFVMKGQHLAGAFSLRKMGKGDKNWLLIKSRDAQATDDAFDIESYPYSILKKDVRANKKTAKKGAIKPAKTWPAAAEEEKFRDFIHPMMARLHDGPFSDPDWIFEIKWDGYRAVAECDGHKVRLYSRSGLNFGHDYPAIYTALQALKTDAVLDGEIVAFDANGKPSFQLLQGARSDGTPLTYQAFDILYYKGKSLEARPLLERKAILKKLLAKAPDVIRYCDHVTGDGEAFFKVAQAKGLEGLIAKKAGSVYEEGNRSAYWLKIKHVQTDEAIICGYTQPKGSRKYFGALLLGMYRDGVLTYIGHTGTGFNTKTLQELYDTMQPYRQDESPFNTKTPLNAPTTWLAPKLVAAIKFTEITKDGIRRHPVFMGLRKDKAAKEVTGADAEAVRFPKAGAGNATAKTKKSTKAAKPVPKSAGHGAGKLPAGTFSNLDKVYFPEEGYTKGDVIEYYNAVYKYILPYLKDRPLSLRRNPNGINDAGFFHKDAGENVPDFVATEVIYSESTDKDIDYIVCNNKPTLLYLANLGCIELNPWHSRAGQLDKPDYLLMDIDPSDNNTFEQVIETAKTIKEVLDSCGAPAFVKTSGSTGLHIYVPMGAKYTYDQVLAFAEIIATRTQEMLPDFTSLERSLKKRGKGNIYIDYLQNRIGQTVACPYSLRPKPHAPVSMPVEWKEVKKGLSIDQFNIKNALKRVERKGDIFAPVLKKGVDLIKCLKALGA